VTGFLFGAALFVAACVIEKAVGRLRGRRTVEAVEAVDVEPVAHLAKAAYAAYGDSTGGKNWQGLPMPTWADLPVTTRAAWMAAVDAVRTELDR